MNPFSDPQFNQNSKKINLLIDFSEEDDFQKSGKIPSIFYKWKFSLKRLIFHFILDFESIKSFPNDSKTITQIIDVNFQHQVERYLLKTSFEYKSPMYFNCDQ